MEKSVNATVGVVNGGVGVNWSFLGLPSAEFRSFLGEFMEAMGFASPETVHIERNDESDGGIDWNRLRISAEECELHSVSPAVAVQKARAWLPSRTVLRRYGLKFILKVPASAR